MGIMINAVDMASQLMAMLPRDEKPQYTEGIQGFFHVISCHGDCEHATVRLIIRDFDEKNFRNRKALLQDCADKLRKQYGQERTELTITHQYSNTLRHFS